MVELIKKDEAPASPDGEAKAGTENARDLIWHCFQQAEALALPFGSYHVSGFSNWHTKVTKDTNLGIWLNETYADRTKFVDVLHRVCLGQDYPDDPMHTFVATVPTATCNELWISLNQLDYSIHAKHGRGLAWPGSEKLSVCALSFSEHGNAHAPLPQHSIPEL